jgi:hypothetical protein
MDFKAFKDGYYEYIKTSDEYDNYFSENNIPITCIKGKEMCEHVLYAIWYFAEHGYTGEMITNNSNKVEFKVYRDDVSDIFTMTGSIRNPRTCDIKHYMEMFEKSFLMATEIHRMKQQLGR